MKFYSTAFNFKSSPNKGSQNFQTQNQKKKQEAALRVEPTVLSWDRPHEPEAIYKKPPTPAPRPPYLTPRYAQTTQPERITLPFFSRSRPFYP